MKIKINLLPLQFIKKIGYVFIVLSIFNLIIQIAKYGFHYRQEWMFIVNMDREMNFPTLYSVILFIICAFLLKQITIFKKAHKSLSFKYWKTLYWIFIYLALDEALQIHEVFIIPKLGQKLPALFHFVWVIPYGIAVVFFLFYFAKFTFKLPQEIKIFFCLSAALFIGGALGMEMIEGLWVRHAGGMQNLVYSLLASIEEMMEMMGLMIFIYSLLIYITKYQQEILSLTINISSEKID